MVFLAMQRNELIHYAHACADEFVFGLSAETRQLEAIRCDAGLFGKSQRGGHLDGR